MFCQPKKSHIWRPFLFQKQGRSNCLLSCYQNIDICDPPSLCTPPPLKKPKVPFLAGSRIDISWWTSGGTLILSRDLVQILNLNFHILEPEEHQPSGGSCWLASFFKCAPLEQTREKKHFIFIKKKNKRNFWRRRIMFYDVRRGTSCCTCPTSRMSVEALPMKMIFSFSIFSCFPSERPETESGNFFLFGSKMLILVTVTRWFQ